MVCCALVEVFKIISGFITHPRLHPRKWFNFSYDFDSKEEHCDPFPMPLNETDRLGFGKGCITKSKRAQLIEFAKSTGMKVIFGLNALVGRTQNEPYWNYTGAWDSSNAEELLSEFSISYPDSIFAYELGNEVIGTYSI